VAHHLSSRNYPLHEDAYSTLRSERVVRDDLRSDAAGEKDESVLDDIEDRGIKVALYWLGAEWERPRRLSGRETRINIGRMLIR